MSSATLIEARGAPGVTSDARPVRGLETIVFCRHVLSVNHEALPTNNYYSSLRYSIDITPKRNSTLSLPRLLPVVSYMYVSESIKVLYPHTFACCPLNILAIRRPVDIQRWINHWDDEMGGGGRSFDDVRRPSSLGPPEFSCQGSQNTWIWAKFQKHPNIILPFLLQFSWNLQTRKSSVPNHLSSDLWTMNS